MNFASLSLFNFKWTFSEAIRRRAASSLVNSIIATGLQSVPIIGLHPTIPTCRQAAGRSAPTFRIGICLYCMRTFTAEAQVWSQAHAYSIFGGQSGNGTHFSPCMSVLSVSIIPPMLHSHISFSHHWCYIILATDSIIQHYWLQQMDTCAHKIIWIAH